MIADNGANPVALTKSGPGQLTLTAANAYRGGTVVSQGTLVVAAGGGDPLGSGPATLAGGALSLSGAGGFQQQLVGGERRDDQSAKRPSDADGRLEHRGNQLSLTGGSGAVDHGRGDAQRHSHL